jgi:hypothetical protein
MYELEDCVGNELKPQGEVYYWEGNYVPIQSTIHSKYSTDLSRLTSVVLYNNSIVNTNRILKKPDLFSEINIGDEVIFNTHTHILRQSTIISSDSFTSTYVVLINKQMKPDHTWTTELRSITTRVPKAHVVKIGNGKLSTLKELGL